MIWVLILHFAAGYSGTTITAEFNSRGACEVAGSAFTAAVEANGRYEGARWPRIIFSCTPKGNG